ncbi:HNH endonuclease [Novipirellula sp.]|uniref:HNH endonuclease n=1 Tax=Novipirellula sp. TaxID=2795430 RepID=UPI0035632311
MYSTPWRGNREHRPNNRGKRVKYWIFNAEHVPTLGCDAADIWFQHNMGFSGNDWEKYGAPLRRLKVGHTVLMYQNDKGFVGIGFVKAPWNEKQYQRKLVYKGVDFPEYRISIDWKYDLRATPFTIGWTSPRFLCSVTKPELIERIREVIWSVAKGHAPRMMADEADEYIPTDEDERELIRQQIKQRRGQQKFRKMLLQRYGSRCQITGCTISHILEAAHIRPYRGPKDNHPDNGLLLRADIHTLFDLDMIGIHPESLDIHCSEAVNMEYGSRIKKTLECGSGPGPSSAALLYRFQRFRDEQQQQFCDVANSV